MANSFVRVIAVEGQTDFPFNFPNGYLSESHIHAYVNEIEVPRTITGGVAIISPVAEGDSVKIARHSPVNPVITFEDGSILNKQNIDVQTLHNIMLAEEYGEAGGSDGGSGGGGGSITYTGPFPPEGVPASTSWYCTSNGLTYILLDDGDSLAWVESNPNYPTAVGESALYVSKAGDTMTGALHIQSPAEADGEAFTIRAESADLPVYLRAWAGEDINWFIGKATSGDGVTWRSYPYGTQLELLEDQVLSNKNILIQENQNPQPNSLTRKDFVEALTILCGVGAEIVPNIPSFLVENPGGLFKALGEGHATPTPGCPPGTGNNIISVVCIPIAPGAAHYLAIENIGGQAGKLFHGMMSSGQVYWTQVHTDYLPSMAMESRLAALEARLTALEGGV